MMVRIITKSTTTIPLSKPPNTVCSGFIDPHGIWNNGFACPIQNFIQFFCCGTDDYHDCCPPDRSFPEINPHHDHIYIPGQYESSDHFIFDQTSRTSLINKSHIINKQFEQFQKIFLPIFLLTSSILFLVGIAIWFWLYKHKAFYAMDRDDLNEQNRVISRTSQSMRSDTMTKKRESINLTMDQQSRRISHPSTEV